MSDRVPTPRFPVRVPVPAHDRRDVRVFRESGTGTERSRSGWVLLCAALLGGCALLGKSAPLDRRYYSAERTLWSAAPPAALSAARTGVASPSVPASLRMGRISSGAHLRERIAYRSSVRELGFYETRRWTERPEAYVRRALASALFEERTLVRAVSGPAATLDVELIDFDELLGPRHAARVRIRAVLTDQRTARFEHTFSAEQAVAKDDDFERVADAMATALSRCVEELSDRVVAELASPSATAASAPPPSADPR